MQRSILFFLLFSQALAGTSDRAVGIMDKGQLSNVTSNFGLLSEFHFFAPAMHWPAGATFEQQYCFGFGPFIAIEDNVVESFISRTYFDWEAVDGALGTLHSGDLVTPDGTPLMAMSDADATWPKDGEGNRFWPGPYRRDAETGEEVVGEFTSDRDIYCVFDDKYNLKEPLGIRVRQLSYSYGRIYAEDFLFFDFVFTNTSDSTIHNLYMGYYGVFRPDYDFKDYISFTGDFIWYEDGDGVPLEPWESLGLIGIGILSTPYDMGVTDFHYFDRTYKPLTDEQMWPIISSDPEDPDINSEYYFHGDDPRIDDCTLIRELPLDSLRAWNFFSSTGPFNLAPGDSFHSAVVVVTGRDSVDLFDNYLTTVPLMVERYYQGSGPPLPPKASVVAGDRRVTLHWDMRAESSVDAITDKLDFEGYKVYRSDDYGETWGESITDEHGVVVGYVPLAIFDLKDGISGRDPAFPQWLGDETGLKHTFVDTNIYNGVEYWYCVTSYDRGNQNPDSLEPSYECGKGRPGDVNVVSAIPRVPASGWFPGEVEACTLNPVEGICASVVAITVIDPSSITGHTYEITFNDSVLVDTSYITTFNLTDVSLSPPETPFWNHPTSDSSGDNIPVVDGFRVALMDVGSGFKSLGWTHVVGDTCTFDWFVEDREPGQMVKPCGVSGIDDFRITIDRTGPGVWADIWSFYGAYGDSINLPLYAEVVTDPENPIPVSEVILVDFMYENEWNGEGFFGPEGWDLTPGGAGWNPYVPYGDYFPDELGFYYYYVEGSDTVAVSYAHIRTQNGPETATPPSDGDQFTIETFKPFSSKVKYRFSTSAAYIEEAISLDQIKVVPNPYIVSAGWEKVWYERKIQFNHLPPICDIHIYTVAGDHVISIHHESGDEGHEFWNLRNKDGLEIAYGLYVYVVEVAGKKKVGKFLVIK